MRKKILYLVLVLWGSVNCFAADWEQSRAKAVEYCMYCDYDLAEKEYTNTIKQLEIVKDEKHPQIYLQRGRMYLVQKKYEEALRDYNKAIDSPHLENKDYLSALVFRIITYANLNKEAEALSDYASFKNFDLCTKTALCECDKQKISDFFVCAQKYITEEDLFMLSNEFHWIRKKPCKCGNFSKEVNEIQLN